MVDVRHLIVRGRYENIPTITSFVGEAAEAAGFADSAVFHCQMAVDEACTNVIEHAYGGDDNGDIQITCRVEAGTCRIEVVDQGDPFEPEAVPEPHTAARLDDIRPGGIGLHLMRQVMDVVEFTFTEDGNHLLMVKQASSEEQQPARMSAIPTEEPEPGLWVIAPTGRMDSAAAPDLEDVLLNLLHEDNVWYVVDLSDVTYISSRGLKAILKAWREAQSNGGDIVLCGLSEPVYTVFDTVGFTQVFSIFDTRGEAVSSLSSRRQHTE